jgi:murein DD-endopeptidase MepM/ murein hydrolase activator NlpD
MREKKHSEILLVPPGGSKIRTLRLRSGLLLFVIIVIAGGFAGYFIPFNSFTIDVVEQNRQTNLETQNKKLLLAIRPMRKLLDNLNEEVQKFEGKSKDIARKLGMKDLRQRQLPQNRPKNRAGLADLLYHVNREGAFFQGFYDIISKHPACFDSIPLVKPLTDDPAVGAHFTLEKDPFTQTMKNHLGVDFVAARGTPVLSTAAGTVAKVEESKIWGKRVTITHAFGFSTVYAHLGTVEAFTGRRVKKGDCIGTVGISGITSGPHVHFEVWYRGEPIDPENLFFPSVDSVMHTALR